MIVVGPLTALMKDQVRTMSEQGVSAVYAGVVDEKTEINILCLGKCPDRVYLSRKAPR